MKREQSFVTGNFSLGKSIKKHSTFSSQNYVFSVFEKNYKHLKKIHSFLNLVAYLYTLTRSHTYRDTQTVAFAAYKEFIVFPKLHFSISFFDKVKI